MAKLYGKARKEQRREEACARQGIPYVSPSYVSPFTHITYEQKLAFYESEGWDEHTMWCEDTLRDECDMGAEWVAEWEMGSIQNPWAEHEKDPDFWTPEYRRPSINVPDPEFMIDWFGYDRYRETSSENDHELVSRSPTFGHVARSAMKRFV